MKSAKMMIVRVVFLTTISLLVSACATQKPFNTAKQINEQCTLEMETARTAVRLRDKGNSREDLAGRLPPLDKNSSRLLVSMYEILDEAYLYSNLNEVVYATYRFELCSRQLTNKKYPSKITHVYPALLECQNKFGNKASAEATQCIVSSLQAENYSVKKLMPQNMLND